MATESSLTKPVETGLKAQIKSYFDDPLRIALIYLLLLAIAEGLTTLAAPQLGLALHGLVLLTLLLHTALAGNRMRRGFLVALGLAPLLRLLSLSLPLPEFPYLYWYFIIGIPLLLATITASRVAGLNRGMLGLNGRGLLWQVLIGVTGLGIGYLEYLILRPDPLAEEFTWQALWLPALILLVFTGFLEELIFRGLLQYTSLRSLGRTGLLYVAAVFAVLHFGYRSFVDVALVFGVALYFGWVVQRTGSILGVTLSHGLTNVALFLIFPFVVGGSLNANRLPAPQDILAPALPTQTQAPTLTPTATPLPTDTPLPTLTPVPGEQFPALLVTPSPSPIGAPSTPTESAPPTPEPTTCGVPAGWVPYTIRAGDTLVSLAQRTGTSVAAIQSANCLTGSAIFAGQQLYLPSVPAANPTQVATATPLPTDTTTPTSPPSSPTPTEEALPSATPVRDLTPTATATLPGSEATPTATATSLPATPTEAPTQAPPTSTATPPPPSPTSTSTPAPTLPPPTDTPTTPPPTEAPTDEPTPVSTEPPPEEPAAIP